MQYSTKKRTVFGKIRLATSESFCQFQTKSRMSACRFDSYVRSGGWTGRILKGDSVRIRERL